jgi:hypothetical protein
VIIVTNWKVAGIYTFVLVVFLGFLLFLVVVLSDNVVYPIDDAGTTDVENVLYSYINPWFVLFELPFVAIGAVTGSAIGSRTMSKGWKVVGGWAILALALLGFCLYITLSFLTYDWLYQLVPQNVGPWPLDTHEFIQQAISNATVLSRYFLTAFVFVVLGLVTGLLGSYRARYGHFP